MERINQKAQKGRQAVTRAIFMQPKVHHILLNLQRIKAIKKCLHKRK
jgi:hypothetical protein